MNHKTIRKLAVIGIFATFTSQVIADDGPLQRYRLGVLVSPFLNYNSLSGSKFDGNWLIRAQTGGINEAIIIPKVDAALGYGGTIGFKAGVDRWPVDLALEIGVSISEPNVTWGGIAGDSKQTGVDFNLKTIFRSGRRLQPAFIIGYNTQSLRVKNASASTGGQIKDATFIGGGLNLGAALSYFVHQNVSLDWAFFHRWHNFDTVEGRIGNISLPSGLDATTLSGMISATFHWGFRRIEN